MRAAPRGSASCQAGGAVAGEVELGRRREVVRPLGVVLDLGADAREAEGPESLAQVVPGDEVPLTGDELQPVRVHGAHHGLVAGDGVVLELHGLALGHGGLQLGQRRGRLARLGDDGERWGLGLGEEFGAPLREAEQGQPERLRVREPVLEDGEAGGQGRELLAVQRDRLEVVGVPRQAVELGGGLGERVLVGADVDTEPPELVAVLVEAALERLLRHQRVPLHAAADLGRGHGLAAARQQQRDQREAPHELVGAAEAFLADTLWAHSATPVVGR